VAGVPEDQIKFNIIGDIAAAQSWSFGVWCGVATTGTPTSADLLAYLQGFETAFAALWTSLKPYNAATCRRTGSSAYFYPAGATHSTLVAHNTITAVPGTGTASAGPRNALVCTLTTATSGRSARGRFYVPVTSAAMGADLQMPSANVDTFTVACQTWLNALRTGGSGSVWGNAPPRVRSEKTGASLIVTGLTVNSLYDTQRRREDKLKPTYTKVLTIP